MSELIIRKHSFEFLPTTAICTLEDMRNYVWELYGLAMEQNKTSDECNGIRKFIPSKFDIMQASWDFFNDQYYQHILSGHGNTAYGRDVRRDIDNGISEEEIMQSIRDIRDMNASYNTHMEMDGEVEKQSLRDIQKLLLLFNISYFNDDSDGFFLSDLKIKDWVNPPFLEVW